MRPLLVVVGAAALLAVPLGRWMSWLTPSLNAFAVIWLVIALVNAVPQMLRQPLDVTATPTVAASGGPNIYLLLLDGYARSDTLADLGYDNQPFLSHLADRGFDVADDATASYQNTTQTIAAMLHMRHLPELPVDVPAAEIEQRRLLRELSQEAPAFEAVLSAGYALKVIAPGFAEVDLEIGDQSSLIGVNEFEAHLMRRVGLHHLIEAVAPGTMYRMYGDRVMAALDRTVAMAAEKGPHLVFAHLISPHAPFIWDSDGEWTEPLPCYPDCQEGETLWRLTGLTRDEYAHRYTGQVQHLNRLVLDAVDAIVAADPTAVVVVFSDHGSRMDETDLDEWYRTLFASRTPGRPDLYAGHEGPTGVMVGLLRGYFGADVPWPEAVRFESLGGPMVLSPRD